jgi:hypothetical protein
MLVFSKILIRISAGLSRVDKKRGKPFDRKGKKRENCFAEKLENVSQG